MSNLKCEELEGYEEMSLARRNACHIKVANSEMGQMQIELSEIKEVIEVVPVMNMKLTFISGIAGVVMLTVIGFVVKSILIKTFNNKK